MRTQQQIQMEIQDLNARIQNEYNKYIGIAFEMEKNARYILPETDSTKVVALMIVIFSGGILSFTAFASSQVVIGCLVAIVTTVTASIIGSNMSRVPNVTFEQLKTCTKKLYDTLMQYCSLQ